jgi:hypothetical protein
LKYRAKRPGKQHFSWLSVALALRCAAVDVALLGKIGDNAGFGRSARRVFDFLTNAC